MDLRRATLWLIVGTVYTLFHKALHGLVPTLSRSPLPAAVTRVFWVAATFTLIVFAYQFLREVRPQDRRLRFSLVSSIVLTGCVMLSQLPLLSLSKAPLAHRLLFGGCSLLNSIALLVFVVTLGRSTASSSPLRAPLRLLFWALGITVALGFAAAGYTSIYLVTGRSVEPLPILQPLSVLSFLFTYGMAMWFLFRFLRLESYANLVEE